jgi:hypothetical protein
MKHVASTTKKFLAAGGLAMSLAGFGLFAGVGTAVADGALPDTGSFDELLNIGDDNGFQDLIAGSYGPWGSVTSSWPGGNAKP